MTVLDRLERAIGHLAIPRLLRVVAVFQVLCFLLIRYNPAFQEFLVLDPMRLREGEVWRLITPAFIPGTLSLFWLFFAILILVIIGDTLEAAWGAFRLNVYFFSMLLMQALAALLFLSPGLPTALYAGIFFAFAVVDPNRTFMLFFVVPVAAKWLAVLTAAFLAWEFSAYPPARASILFTLLPFAIYAVPKMVRRMRDSARVQVRRAAYRANSLEPSPHFHRCATCGRTDHDHPELDFRVADDGTEYCTDHLPGA